MRVFVLSLVILFCSAGVNVAFPRANYSSLRNEILEYEQRLMVGANITLNEIERVANGILTKAKDEELNAGFKNPLLFAPSRNFIEAKKDIEKSKVFELLRRMPKGAVLHTHDTSLVSSDYIYHNITFRDDLYVCIVDCVVKLRFFREPDQTCDWKLLKKVREDPIRGKIVEKMIQERMSMEVNDPMAAYPNVDMAWTKFSDIFAFIGPLVTFRPVYEDHFLEALEQLYQDNVMYLELRSTLPTLYDFDGTNYMPEDLVGIYERLTERFKKEHPDFIGVKLIYAPSRMSSHQQTEDNIKTMKLLKKKYPKFMAGFDLVGQEDKGYTLKYFADILRNGEEDNINFFFHAGETNWLGASTDENLVDAILLNTKRIGHGYALNSHPFLLELTKRLDIAIEINPISNQVLKLVDDLRNHAARRLFSEGYPVVISNDDPGFWGSRALSYDFYEAFMALMSKHADLRSLKQVALNSLHYSSLTNSEKEKALALWQEKWDTFVEDVVRDNY
ncbi:Adenosine deaminase CECR1 [Habropoda laboriosa]|uniref:Adenosine deaminase n=1 Tax=Habropoda laboriosa TaxID=597456 RepID=A0A0L7R411_9HYME|nr:PREDICTED: adenosine deaminase CECR1-like [Habropoda laboriosa]KOC65564.1 Adenosine deaminase CECR1 [Habropoda laboriosa]